MPQIYSFFLIPQQYHLLHLGIIYEQTPGKVLPGKAQFPFFSPLSSNAKMYEMHISYNTKYASRTLTHYSLVSIRPRACFSPSYNKVKSQTKHVWLLTLL